MWAWEYKTGVWTTNFRKGFAGGLAPKFEWFATAPTTYCTQLITSTVLFERSWSYGKNLNLSLNVSILKNSVQKKVASAFCVFQHLGFFSEKMLNFVVSKPLGQHRIMDHQWKDNTHIFHLAPIFLRMCHWWGHNELLKKSGLILPALKFLSLVIKLSLSVQY